MTFSIALMLLKEGRAVARTGWNGKDMCIKMQRPDTNSKMTLPYLFIEYMADNRRCPWLASQTDLLAEDWYQVDIAWPPRNECQSDNNHYSIPGRPGGIEG